jgi:5,10-methylenetetrahydrofolate reductase
MPAAPRSRAGCGASSRASATTADSIRAFGLDVVTELCQRLIERGAPGLHFYSMNQAGLTLELCNRLGLQGR